MRILLLNQTFYPDSAATSQYLTDLGIELVRHGFEVDVISDARSYVDRSTLLPKSEVHQGIRIFRVLSTGFGKKTKLHRGLDYLTFNISLLLKLFSFPKYDVVIGLTTPPWISFFGMLFCKLKGGKFIHWAMDVNPDEAVRLGWIKQGSLFHKMLNAWATITYKKSERIIVLDKYMAQTIIRKGIDQSKISIIPLWSHKEIQPIEHSNNPFREEYSLNHTFIVMYAGNFSICHPIHTLLESAKILRDKKDILFMFIGGGVRLNEIMRFKEEHRLDNIVYLPYQKRENIKYSLSAADLHIVSMGDEFVGIVHPSKIYNILCTGRPFVLLGPEQSDIGDMIAQYKIGYKIDHGDVCNMVQLIDNLKNASKEEKQRLCERQYEIAVRNYSGDSLIKKIISVVTRTSL